MIVDVKHAMDLHIHAGPELFQRIGDGIEIAQRAREAGMRGVAYKCHHESTVGRAYFVRKEAPGIEVFGGVVLNDFVGGLNPEAVRAALESGGKIVWMPTMHSAYHISIFGRGTYGIKSMTVANGEEQNAEGITAVDERGRLRSDVESIIQLVAKYKAVLGTSHLHPREIERLAPRCREAGATLVITHPLFLPRGEPLEYYVRLAKEGAYLELCGVILFPMALYQGGEMTLQNTKDLIDAVGPERCLMSTDSGQPFNPWPHETLRIYAQLLADVGVSERDLKIMMVENPAMLLGLSA